MEKENIILKNLPKNFGYRCINLVLNEDSVECHDGNNMPFLAKTVGDLCDKLYTFKKDSINFNLRTYVKRIPHGEGSRFDSITAQECMERFTGKQIVRMFELGKEIAKYKTFPDHFIAVLNKTLPDDVLRIIHYEIYRTYLQELSSDYIALQNIIHRITN